MILDVTIQLGLACLAAAPAVTYGFLDCSSQAGAGTVWFYDTAYTAGGEPLSHNQSRRPCFRLHRILRDDL